jgi:hypothetical protein
MGELYQAVSKAGLIKDYQNPGLNYPHCQSALISPGKSDVNVPVADISMAEVDLLAHRLDQMASSRQNDNIAVAVAEEFANIVLLVRRVKKETGGTFAGTLGAGADLTALWLLPKDVGGPILNSAAAGALGLYTGGGGAVFTWLATFVANTIANMIPAQQMIQWAGVLHIGILDNVDVPKIQAARVTIAGQVAPKETLMLDNRRQNGDSYNTSFQRFEKPWFISPLITQAIDLMPGPAGDSRPELVSILIARIQDLVF